MRRAILWGDDIPIGKFFQRSDLLSLDQSEPILRDGLLVRQNLRLKPRVVDAFTGELM
jgi:2-oxoglutarate/2-oxoacid ferredoxin oxidoreductase subunit beta